MKKFLLIGVFLSLFIATYFLQPSLANMQVYCKNKCKGRCLKTGYSDKCVKYCEICCQECKCVPTNMYDNKHECPCYKDKKNNKGKPRCP